MAAATTFGVLLVLASALGGAADIGAQRPPAGFNPSRQQLIVQHSGETTARLQKSGSVLEMIIEVRGSKIGALRLPEIMAQVDAVNFTEGEKIAVFGHVNGSVRQVVVIDIASRRIIDQFYCYEPVLSPNKRFLTFIKFFPPHFVPGVSYQYLLYDFQKGPVANRPSNIPADDPQNVGLVLYPRYAKNQLGDNTGQLPGKVHTLWSGTFFWSAQGNRVAFADNRQDVVTVVVVALLGPTPSLQITEHKLAKSEICKSPDEATSCVFTVSSIQFMPYGLKLFLRPSNGEIKTEIDLEL